MDHFTTIMDTLSAKFVDAAFWGAIVWGAVKILLIIVLARLVIRLASGLVDRVISHRAVKLDERRSKTISKMLLNIVKYVVYFFVILTVLANLGIEVTTIIAGAGVAGLAIGFGAQSLVKDVITGFFIIFEDQFGVGDNIMINMNPQTRGNVEEVGLRISKIRAYTGEIHIFANSQISQVTNYSKSNSLAVIDVSVAYEEDLDRVFKALQEVGEHAHKELSDLITGEPQVLGVQAFGASDVIVRMTVETKPMEHYGVGRELRRMIKAIFEREGIEIPYPKQVMYAQRNEGAAVPTTVPETKGKPEGSA